MSERLNGLILIGMVICGLFVVKMLPAGNGSFGFGGAKISQPAPAIVVSKVGNNRKLSDADLNTGGVKLVNFWGSWCGPCRSEHSTLVEIAESGTVIYGVSRSEPAEKSAAFLVERGNPYHAIGADDSNRTAAAWGVRAVPTTFVVDSEGIIRKRITGPITPEIYESQILPLVKPASGVVVVPHNN